MKKNGIINPKLIYELTNLGHFDSFVICDMGFPIPEGKEKIDLTFTAGNPEFLPVLKACLNEVVVQDMVLLDGIKTANADLHKDILDLVHNQEITYVDLPGFRKKAKEEAKFYIRTGETRPCSNIMLVSASGVAERVKKYDIKIKEEQA